MDYQTRQAIIHNHVEPLIANTAAKVSEYLGSIVIESDWQTLSQDRFVDFLAQDLGAKGYDVDVYREGDTVIIDDREVED